MNKSSDVCTTLKSYGVSNLYNWMCVELSFSQIWSVNATEIIKDDYHTVLIAKLIICEVLYSQS